MTSTAATTIGPRQDAGGGIQSSHSYDAWHRVINGTTYRFVRHHHLMSPGREGIQAYRLETDAAGRLFSVEVFSVGCRIPKRGW